MIYRFGMYVHTFVFLRLIKKLQKMKKNWQKSQKIRFVSKIALILMLFFGAQPVSASAFSPVDAFNFRGPKVTISIGFGKPSKECKGFGICNLDVSVDWTLKTSASSNAIGSAWVGERGELYVEFSSETVMSSRTSGNFTGGGVWMETLTISDAATLQALGVKSPITIPAGFYKFTQPGSNVIKFSK